MRFFCLKFTLVLALVLALGSPQRAAAQGATGSVRGAVTDALSGAAVIGAQVALEALRLRTVTDSAGRYILTGVPPREHEISVTALGYSPRSQRVQVVAGRTSELNFELQVAAVVVEGIEARAERVPLIEPDISVTHEIVDSRELRTLPIDAVSQAVELAPGVSDGHFRGGRIGQESYVVDGLELKNQLEGSSQGLSLEFSPSSLAEIEVLTGGFGAAYGSALSGVVKLVTRRGDTDQWRGRATGLTDHWAPEGLFRGYTGVSLSAGGPVDALGVGTTFFADVFVQGMLDSEPRGRGLTCLESGDVPANLAERVDALRNDPATAPLYCPFSNDVFPNQQGDKLIGFMRLDRPLGGNTTLTASVLNNRLQTLLYTSEFKYNPSYQLGQRTNGTLGQLALDWTKHESGRAMHFTARGALMRLDRHLGALDMAAHRERSALGDIGLAGFEFIGEEFAHSPIESQEAAGGAVPGYIEPGGSSGSPFGVAAEGIFFTEGTPHIANWSRTDMYAADLAGELLSAAGHQLQMGASAKMYGVESYERIHAYSNDSEPVYADFAPATVNAFAEGRLAAADEVTVFLGARLEAFRSGLELREVGTDSVERVASTEWKVGFLPRIGIALPIPGSAGRTALRLSYGRVAQPPDFRFFLDTSLGDSLRSDIRRQGNPNLSFERGSAFELGLSQLIGERVGVSLVAFRKELTNLVTGSLSFSGTDEGTFTTGDFGRVHGVEVSARARWNILHARFGYALQKAYGVAGTALDDSITTDPVRTEFPLPFDRRHAFDFALLAGQATGAGDSRWSATLVGSAKSGIPLDRRLAGGDVHPDSVQETTYLPWNATIDLRASRDVASAFLCGSCDWRIVVDARNLLGRENVIGLRRETGLVGPELDDVLTLANSPPGPAAEPIPRESAAYSEPLDLNGDGLITAGEYSQVRFAAALDRFDPSLFFGASRQLRLGVEVVF